MSELSEAMALSAALPKLHAEAVERLTGLLHRLPVSTIHTLADAIEKHGGADVSGIMKAYGVKVRVAVWELRDNRCWHAELADGRTLYEVGNTQRAKVSDIDAQGRWVEAWIA